jgi:hypothetical protein
MALGILDSTNLDSIGEAIRRKNGATEKYSVDEMPEAIDNIKTDPVLQSKIIYPMAIDRTETADPGYDGLSSVTVRGDSALKNENIAYGKTIFEVDGTFTGDATAYDDVILEGHTAYVKGEKVTGSLKTICDDALAMHLTIKAGGGYEDAHIFEPDRARSYYFPDGFIISVSGSKINISIENLNPENIKQGVWIAGVEGSYTGK